MYIDIEKLLKLLLILVCIIALICLIITLIKLSRFISELSSTLNYNRKSIDITCQNTSDITSKISEIIPEDVNSLVSKDPFLNNIENIMSLVLTFINYFFNKSDKE